MTRQDYRVETAIELCCDREVRWLLHAAFGFLGCGRVGFDSVELVTDSSQPDAPTVVRGTWTATPDGARQLFVWGGSFTEATGAVWTPEP